MMFLNLLKNKKSNSKLWKHYLLRNGSVLCFIVLVACNPQKSADKQSHHYYGDLKQNYHNNGVMGSVDSIRSAYLINRDSKYLDSLEIISCNSDGEASEEISEMMIELYEKYPVEISGYLYDNKNSCLKKKFTNGLSEKLSVFEKKDRNFELNKYRVMVPKKRNDKLYNYMQKKIFDDVKPELFD